MKRVGIGIVMSSIVFVMMLVVGCGNGNNSSDEPTASPLFVQSASSGTFAANGDGTYTFRMQGVMPNMFFFLDKPKRGAGQISLVSFLHMICFDPGNPPKAAIQVMGIGQENNVTIVSLTNPQYDADAATLQYTARILKDANFSVPSFNEDNNGEIPSSFGPVALFLDGCSQDVGIFNCPDVQVTCGDKNGNEAGTVTCCTCWTWKHGCDFRDDCCSFDRCQQECIDTYGEENNYLFSCTAKWVDNKKDFFGFCSP